MATGRRARCAPFKPIDPPPPTKRVVVIDKPDAVQTEIRVGQLGIPRKHDDYLALDQAVKILGGEGANRLQQVLRSQRGLTYGASADLDTYKTCRRHRRRDRYAHRAAPPRPFG